MELERKQTDVINEMQAMQENTTWQTFVWLLKQINQINVVMNIIATICSCII